MYGICLYMVCDDVGIPETYIVWSRVTEKVGPSSSAYRMIQTGAHPLEVSAAAAAAAAVKSAIKFAQVIKKSA